MNRAIQKQIWQKAKNVDRIEWEAKYVKDLRAAEIRVEEPAPREPSRVLAWACRDCTKKFPSKAASFMARGRTATSHG